MAESKQMQEASCAASQVHPRAERADLKKMGKKGAVSGPGTVPSTGNRQDFI